MEGQGEQRVRMMMFVCEQWVENWGNREVGRRRWGCKFKISCTGSHNRAGLSLEWGLSAAQTQTGCQDCFPPQQTLPVWPHSFLLSGILYEMGQWGVGRGNIQTDISLCLATSKDRDVCLSPGLYLPRLPSGSSGGFQVADTMISIIW